VSSSRHGTFPAKQRQRVGPKTPLGGQSYEVEFATNPVGAQAMLGLLLLALVYETAPGMGPARGAWSVPDRLRVGRGDKERNW
jgi:hypothetical protein